MQLMTVASALASADSHVGPGVNIVFKSGLVLVSGKSTARKSYTSDLQRQPIQCIGLNSIMSPQI